MFFLIQNNNIAYEPIMHSLHSRIPMKSNDIKYDWANFFGRLRFPRKNAQSRSYIGVCTHSLCFLCSHQIHYTFFSRVLKSSCTSERCRHNSTSTLCDISMDHLQLTLTSYPVDLDIERSPSTIQGARSPDARYAHHMNVAGIKESRSGDAIYCQKR
jgi:hypothetical protein